MVFVFLKRYRKIVRLITIIIFLFAAHDSFSQKAQDSLLAAPDLPNIIQYALKRQPLVQQALADERITELQVKSKLADWYPQVNFNYLYQHNFQVQTSVIGG